MILLIDIGNTNIVFSIYDVSNNKFKSKWRITTNANRTADEYASWLLPLFSIIGVNFKDIKDCVISSVVPNANHNIRSLITEYFKRESVFIKSSDEYLGINIDLDNPKEVGTDRLIDALAIKEHYTYPSVIIDFGTATTFNLINDKGDYAGGVITLGVNLSLEALYKAAAKLPKIELEKPHSIIGKNTVQAMRSGIFYGYISMIEGLINKFRSELDYSFDVYATGGLANTYSEHIEDIIKVDDDLTIKGLVIAYNKYKNNIKEDNYE